MKEEVSEKGPDSISRRSIHPGRPQDFYPDWFLHMLAFQHELLLSPQHGKWSQFSWLVRTSSGLAFVGSKWRPCSASFSLTLFFGPLREHRNWIADSLSLEWDVKLVLRAPLFWMTDQNLVLTSYPLTKAQTYLWLTLLVTERQTRASLTSFTPFCRSRSTGLVGWLEADWWARTFEIEYNL